ncbi:Protein big1 [Erysiphe neolycopersici]|uniref:Protein BIG1 n=1 Tax=Erysiphe neolycopersici TaxID=212602 RepID=A0A420HX74_9PEZI|nr:Protein big1 [Erysiphe neolycopersici]
MLLFLLALSALNFGIVQAFRDTSPFLLLSTNPSSEPIKHFSTEPLKSRAQVFETSKSFLSKCPSDTYFILTHPSVSAEDLSKNASYLSQAINNLEFPTKILIRETVGLKTDDGERLATYLEEKCGSKRATGWVFNEIKGQREQGGSLVISKKFEGEMKETDVSLSTNILANIAEEFNYSIILLTTPPKSSEGQDYGTTESKKTQSHLELKRQLSARAHKISKDADLRPLFTKYQFFSPGIFIGILVTIILITILSVGIRAISGLEVSYGAFEKEQGPVTSKKSL